MALLTAAIVSDATGYDVAASGDPDGVCERALNVEDEAAAEALDVLGSSVYAEVTGADYSGAASGSDNAKVYGRVRRAVARLAVAHILPTLGAGRPTSKGGIQQASGPESERVRFMSARDVRGMAADLREQATTDLRRIAEAVGEASDSDTIHRPEVLYVL